MFVCFTSIKPLLWAKTVIYQVQWNQTAVRTITAPLINRAKQCNTGNKTKKTNKSRILIRRLIQCLPIFYSPYAGIRVEKRHIVPKSRIIIQQRERGPNAKKKIGLGARQQLSQVHRFCRSSDRRVGVNIQDIRNPVKARGASSLAVSAIEKSPSGVRARCFHQLYGNLD